MKNLEDFIKNNKEQISSFDLPQEHLERFEKKLYKKNTINKIYWYSLAATVLILISLSVFIRNEQLQTNDIVNTESLISLGEVSPQYKEVEEFYRKDLYRKIYELQQLNCKINPEQKEMIDEELQQLDKVYQSLQEELKQNQSDERIINAMINNYQYKIEFLELVIEQIKENC
ncbi:MAG: hypothetical protein L3J74_09250 [Bacteroidales bacterium]|nr:hypothetical protein [Bacteroidales bacterium]